MARTVADAFNQYHQQYVKPQMNKRVQSNSPALTGTPTAPTADNDTDSTQIATTEFVQNIIRRLCGVDTKTIALLADLANALLNQSDFRDAVVTVLDGKLNKSDAATTYLSKSDANSTYMKKSDGAGDYIKASGTTSTDGGFTFKFKGYSYMMHDVSGKIAQICFDNDGGIFISAQGKIQLSGDVYVNGTQIG